jgi:hypothetical protein
MTENNDRIDFVSVDKGDANNPPSGMDRNGRWWYWNRETNRWEKGCWTSERYGNVMYTPTDRHE